MNIWEKFIGNNKEKKFNRQLLEVMENVVLLPDRKIDRKMDVNPKNLVKAILEDFGFVFSIFPRLAQRNLANDSRQSKDVKKEMNELLERMSEDDKDRIVDIEKTAANVQSKLAKVQLVHQLLKKNIKGTKDYYWPLGFSPRLAQEGVGVNCFGYTQILAFFLEKFGIDFKMAIGANHEFCLIEIDNDKYLLSIYGLQKMPKFELTKKVQVYIKSEVDSGELSDLAESILVICDFYEGTLYRYFENFRFYGDYSSGKTVFSILLTEEKEMEKFSAQIGKGLAKIDWREFQDRYCPEISEVFKKIGGEIVEEYSKLENHYENVRTEAKLNKIFRNVFVEMHSSNDKRKLNSYAIDFITNFGMEKCKDAILFYGDDFIRHYDAGTVNENWPLFFKNFTIKVREHINLEEDEKQRTQLRDRLFYPILLEQEEAKLLDQAMKSVDESAKKLQEYVDEKNKKL